jgi:hypothetical protein
MAFKKKEEMGYIPEKGTEHLFHIELNTRIHDDAKQEYQNNWNIKKFNDADFIDFCKNGGTFLKLFVNPVIKEKNAEGIFVQVKFDPKTADECLKIFDVEENEKYIKLLHIPSVGKKKTIEAPEETEVPVV